MNFSTPKHPKATSKLFLKPIRDHRGTGSSCSRPEFGLDCATELLPLFLILHELTTTMGHRRHLGLLLHCNSQIFPLATNQNSKMSLEPFLSKLMRENGACTIALVRDDAASSFSSRNVRKRSRTKKVSPVPRFAKDRFRSESREIDLTPPKAPTRTKSLSPCVTNRVRC